MDVFSLVVARSKLARAVVRSYPGLGNAADNISDCSSLSSAVLRELCNTVLDPSINKQNEDR